MLTNYLGFTRFLVSVSDEHIWKNPATKCNVGRGAVSIQLIFTVLVCSTISKLVQNIIRSLKGYSNAKI